jgi:hypothetical protein
MPTTEDLELKFCRERVIKELYRSKYDYLRIQFGLRDTHPLTAIKRTINTGRFKSAKDFHDRIKEMFQNRYHVLSLTPSANSSLGPSKRLHDAQKFEIIFDKLWEEKDKWVASEHRAQAHTQPTTAQFPAPMSNSALENPVTQHQNAPNPTPAVKNESTAAAGPKSDDKAIDYDAEIRNLKQQHNTEIQKFNQQLEALKRGKMIQERRAKTEALKTDITRRQSEQRELREKLAAKRKEALELSVAHTNCEKEVSWLVDELKTSDEALRDSQNQLDAIEE